MIRVQFFSALIYRVLFHFALLLVFFLPSTSVAKPGRISSDQTLIIGGNKDFAPYEYLNSKGIPVGHNIDLIKAVAQKQGLHIKIVLDTWHNTRRDLEDKKIDAVTGMLYSMERDKIFDFSVPYLIIPYTLFKRKETPLRSRDDVKDKEIIVVESVYAHDWLVEKQFTDSIISVNNPTEALQLLASGKHDFTVLPRLHGINLLDDLKIKNVDAAGPPVLSDELSFAVAEGNSPLLAELNEGIVSLQKSGEYDEIYLKWFSVNKYNKHVRKVTKYVLLVFTAVILLLLTVLCWNWFLKRAVRRKSEELHHNEARLTQIVENIPIPTYVVDEHRQVTHWNRACEFLTGETADQMVGTRNYHMALYDDQPYSIVDLLLENTLTKRVQQHDNRTYRESSLLEGAYTTEVYFSNLGIDGKWLYGTAALLTDKTGKISGAIETWQDLTESKQLERQLIQSQKMEAIGTLAGGIAHDFNNILTVVEGNAELALLDLPKKSTLTDNLKQIHAAGKRAKKLVQQILTFSRHAENKTEPVQVSTIVEETLRFITSSQPPNIKVQHDIQSDAFVMADATHIHQVVMNLCTNAIHAMEAGGILGVYLKEVEIVDDQIRPEGFMMPGRFIKLTVSDTGQGIPLGIGNKIFDPFFTTKKRGEGTGMGLSVTHGIVQQYGGGIHFDSAPGKGSSFHVYLPEVTDDVSGTNSIE